MGKINIDKANGFTPVRAERQGDVKRSRDTAPAPASPKDAGGDRLDLSARASEVGRLVEKLKEMPELRQEKVNALREKIHKGEYHPSGDQIADAILKDA
jgi:flagellar biosynthesis anti-sigma factor FlgM